MDSIDMQTSTSRTFILTRFVDRFIAVSVPLGYNQKRVDYRQTVLLSATWLLALAVASPIIFGINKVPQRDPKVCKLEDDNYIVYSSICSFFIPCPIMLLLYCGMFYGLRHWEEARKLRLKKSIHTCRKLHHAAAAAALPPLAVLPTSMPVLPQVIQQDLTQCNVDDLDDMQSRCSLPPEYNNSALQAMTYAGRKKRAKLNGRERKAMRVLPVVVGENLNKYIIIT